MDTYFITHKRNKITKQVTKEHFEALLSKKMFAENFNFKKVTTNTELETLSADELISRHVEPNAEPTKKKSSKKIDNSQK